MEQFYGAETEEDLGPDFYSIFQDLVLLDQRIQQGVYWLYIVTMFEYSSVYFLLINFTLSNLFY